MLSNATTYTGGRSHDYPKMQVSYLFIFDHWRSHNMPINQMLLNQMSLVNEELGEISFSMLGRCVLGDNIKSDINHMNIMYKLLPVYREVKNDIMADRGSSNSLTYHHKIQSDSKEVTATGFFFNQCIQKIMSGHYQSYNGSKEALRSSQAASTNMTPQFSPIVYLDNVIEYLPAIYETINNNIYGHFLHDYKHIWTEADVEVLPQHNEQQDIYDSDSSENKEPVSHWGPPWVECIVGHMAVIRRNFTHTTKGICVFKIVSIHNAAAEIGDVDNKFEGKEYTCTIINNDIDCVRQGIWHARANSRQPTQMIYNYEVICYFDNFSRYKLPKLAVDAIMFVMEDDELFS